MAIEISDVIDRYKQKLQQIPKEMPAHWKSRNGLDLVTTNIDQCSRDCEICGGSGYFREEIPLHQNGFGQLKLCPNVNRFKLPYSRRYGIVEDEARNLGWGDIKKIGDAIGIKETVEAVQETLRKGYGWVFIHGDFGIGKTLILKIAAALTIQKGQDAAYVRMAEILDHLRAAFDEDSQESEGARLGWWTDLPVLCIDEFDKVRSTAYGKERSFVLLDRRYDQAIRQESVTIIASNEPPDSFDGYLYDRIRDGRFFVREIRGESARPGMRYD